MSFNVKALWLETKYLKFVKMLNSQELESLGAQVELADNPLGKQKLPDGSEIQLPPILLGTLGNDPKKHTVSASCIIFLPAHFGIISQGTTSFDNILFTYHWNCINLATDLSQWCVDAWTVSPLLLCSTAFLSSFHYKTFFLLQDGSLQFIHSFVLSLLINLLIQLFNMLCLLVFNKLIYNTNLLSFVVVEHIMQVSKDLVSHYSQYVFLAT